MSTMLEELRRKRDDAIERMDDVANRIQALPEDAPDEERSALDGIFDSEKGSVERLTDAIRKREVIEKQRQELAPQDDDEPDDGPRKQIRVGKEPLTFRKNGPHQYLDTVVRANIDGDDQAKELLQRHAAEMRVEMRDLTTTAGAGGEMVTPLYLQDDWITLARAGRVTANIMSSRDLPPGTNSLTVPRLSGGAATAVQASENSAVQETDPTTNSLTVGVKTIAGQVDLSRQLFDLSQPGMDEIIMADLAADYATKLDVQVISGSGSSGQALGIRNVSSVNTVTYTDASPTVGKLYPKIADAWQQIATGLFRGADAIVMHPRRWAWFQGAVDSSGRPLASAEAPQNAVARGGGSVTEGLAGSIQGLPVYIDPNLPTNLGAGTNEDIILVLRTSELLLFERGAPFTRVFEDVGSNTLTVRISLWNYFAFAAGRYPKAISIISGTGLAAPTF